MWMGDWSASPQLRDLRTRDLDHGCAKVAHCVTTRWMGDWSASPQLRDLRTRDLDLLPILTTL